jgi:hypothetical protein
MATFAGVNHVALSVRDRFTLRGRPRSGVARRFHRAARVRAGARPRVGAGERDIPEPGERARDWWVDTGAVGDQEEAARESVCDFKTWPPIRIRALAGADDLFFPVDFQRRVAHDRLGVEVDVLPGGHLLPLVQPRLVAGFPAADDSSTLSASIRLEGTSCCSSAR